MSVEEPEGGLSFFHSWEITRHLTSSSSFVSIHIYIYFLKSLKNVFSFAESKIDIKIHPSAIHVLRMSREGFDCKKKKRYRRGKNESNETRRNVDLLGKKWIEIGLITIGAILVTDVGNDPLVLIQGNQGRDQRRNRNVKILYFIR